MRINMRGSAKKNENPVLNQAITKLNKMENEIKNNDSDLFFYNILSIKYAKKGLETIKCNNFPWDYPWDYEVEAALELLCKNGDNDDLRELLGDVNCKYLRTVIRKFKYLETDKRKRAKRNQKPSMFDKNQNMSKVNEEKEQKISSTLAPSH